MKKFSVIVLALVMLMSLSFAASAADSVVIDVVDVEIAPDAETVEVVINYETTDYLLDGGFEITFPADKLELQVAEATGPKDPANDLTALPNGQVNVKEKADGKVIVAFMSDAGADATGCIIKMPFKVLAAAAGDEYEITIKATRLVKWVDGVAAGENLVTEEVDFATTGKVVVKAAETTTEAPATTTEAPATTTEAPATTTAPTTKKPAPTGEATPWALMATVAVAGAALVVLSTKKSK